jgi:hypothetical protein
VRLHDIKKAGKILGRQGISERVISLVNRFDGSYKGAVDLIGRLSVLEQACRFDVYWEEKAFLGSVKEEGYLQRVIETDGKAERDPPDVSVLVPIEVYRSMRETVVTSPRVLQNHVHDFLKSRGEELS